MALPRNASRNIDSPGQFMTVVADVVTDILAKMVAAEERFDINEFWLAVIAGVASGALGPSTGSGADQLTLELRNVLRDRYTAAAAAANKNDLAAIATVAHLLGDDELRDLAVEAIQQP